MYKQVILLVLLIPTIVFADWGQQPGEVYCEDILEIQDYIGRKAVGQQTVKYTLVGTMLQSEDLGSPTACDTLIGKKVLVIYTPTPGEDYENQQYMIGERYANNPNTFSNPLPEVEKDTYLSYTNVRFTEGNYEMQETNYPEGLKVFDECYVEGKLLLTKEPKRTTGINPGQEWYGGMIEEPYYEQLWAHGSCGDFDDLDVHPELKQYDGQYVRVTTRHESFLDDMRMEEGKLVYGDSVRVNRIKEWGYVGPLEKEREPFKPPALPGNETNETEEGVEPPIDPIIELPIDPPKKDPCAQHDNIEDYKKCKGVDERSGFRKVMDWIAFWN